MTAQNLYEQCIQQLKESGNKDAKSEALFLIECALGFDRTALIAHGNTEIDGDKVTLLKSMTKRRVNGEPLQYVAGRWNFCGFDFEVGKGVLIPRDDTEVVVNLCIDFLQNRNNKKTLDLCAGSGAISVALAKLAQANVTAVELSDTAFDYLCKNIQGNNAEIKTVKDNIFNCYQDFADNEFDLIVSNPPYIKTADIKTLQSEVRQEPVMALDGGESGFDFYEEIIKNWSRKLKDGGALAFELGEDQADYVAQLMSMHGFENITTSLDLGNVQRAIIGTVTQK